MVIPSEILNTIFKILEHNIQDWSQIKCVLVDNQSENLTSTNQEQIRVRRTTTVQERIRGGRESTTPTQREKG